MQQTNGRVISKSRSIIGLRDRKGWRRGKELNQPRQGSLADNGFEDRGAHQVLISLLFLEQANIPTRVVFGQSRGWGNIKCKVRKKITRRHEISAAPLVCRRMREPRFRPESSILRYRIREKHLDDHSSSQDKSAVFGAMLVESPRPTTIRGLIRPYWDSLAFEFPN